MRSKSNNLNHHNSDQKTTITVRTAYPASRNEKPKLLASDYTVSAGAFRKNGMSKTRGSVQTPSSALGLPRSHLLFDKNA